ncbi:hypothetical protein LMG6871_01282 [Ralstonia edaphis]|uniref:hypothetical protein n=1 Tax=Ralstonia edaphi TaxID=3058599 RepID=UPI0028F51E82|nr:hypothetical protein [Ralstonia sp. LMG 6871]CAJ0714959.1 hypothetical protein LMG6871_01282 [Ralstonia sp. LMG 6871]
MCNKPVSGAPLLEEACQLGSMVNGSHRCRRAKALSMTPHLSRRIQRCTDDVAHGELNAAGSKEGPATRYQMHLFFQGFL